ncbi:MAG: PolC-type DNA polymerase III [Patescibacteria group bacterium]
MHINELVNKSINDITFSVIDTETTGMFPEHNKVMDIGIVLVKNGEIIDKWETLIDPRQKIPYWITTFTNLRDADVAGKPIFREIAHKVNELTNDTIFVAHNVGFDYPFIASEMQNVGHLFEVPRICTVQLSRKLLPNLPSANLDTLSEYFNIKISARHRALPDAEATAVVLIELVKIASKKYGVKNFFDLERLQRIKVDKENLTQSFSRPTLF